MQAVGGGWLGGGVGAIQGTWSQWLYPTQSIEQIPRMTNMGGNPETVAIEYFSNSFFCRMLREAGTAFVGFHYVREAFSKWKRGFFSSRMFFLAAARLCM